MVALSEDSKRKYSIIVAIATNNEPTLDDISKVTNLPVSTLKRQIAQIRVDPGVDIKFVPNKQSNSKGRTGHYHILDWGVLDRTEFMVRHGNILEQI